MRNIHDRLVCGASAAAMAIFFGGIAHAQSASPPVAAEAQAAENSGGIEEIVVTARRESESGQTVPVTVDSFSEDSLRQATIVTATDLQSISTGISTQGTGSAANAFYSVRGITRQLTGNGQAGVVSYFAEVPLQNAGSNLPFFDMSNVQVLKGPQGTLFGRNTVGGAILLYPNTPDFEFGGYLMGRVGNLETRAVEGAVNVPIIDDRLAVRVAGLFDRDEGYTRNLGGNGKNLDARRERAIRASVLVQPFDGLRNTFIFDYDNLNTSSSSIILSGGTLPQLVAAAAQQKLRGPRVTNTGTYQPRERLRRRGIANRTEFDISDQLTLINIFGYRSVDYIADVNLDGFELPVVEGRRAFQYRQYTDELQLHADLFDDKLKLIVGGFYLKSKPSGGNVNDTTILFVDAPASYAFEKATSKALFANVNLDLGGVVDGLRLNAGYRHTWDKQNVCSAGSFAPGQPGYVPGVSGFPYDVIGAGDCNASTPGLTNVGSATASFDAPGWVFGLDWQASRSLFLYATTRRGYRAGGVNNPTLGTGLQAFQTFSPETNTDVEIGAKTDWWVGGVAGRFNVSAFYSWQNNVQIAYTGVSQSRTQCLGNPPAPVFIDGDCDLSNNPASGALTINSGKTRIRGIEAELTLKPASWLTLNGQITLLDPSIRRGVIPAAPVGAVVAPGGTFNFNQFLNQNLADTTVAAGAQFKVPIPEQYGEITFSFDHYYTSKVPVNALIVPAYNNTNMRIDWDRALGSPVDLSFYWKNVFDKTHLVGASFSPVAFAPFLVSGVYNRPSTFGLEGRIRF